MLAIFGALLSSLGVTAGVAGLGALGAIGVAFLVGRTLRSLAIAAGLAAAFATGLYATGYLKGSAAARLECQTANLKAEIARLRRESAAMAATLEAERDADAKRQTYLDQLQQQVEAVNVLAGSIAADTDRACPVAVTAGELQAIRAIGETGRSPAKPSSPSWWRRGLLQKDAAPGRPGEEGAPLK